MMWLICPYFDTVLVGPLVQSAARHSADLGAAC